ncbi:carboxylic acid reductase [Mycobacterium sp. 3519A]|uniref:carboxylic acid reductase n=1 Tax=Mycobacterium sp. 3519A TaxID=2057184 RepID=UPI000C7A5BA1|nr:carboxylic acid reductase [Mycobacterium sp. 3519A]
MPTPADDRELRSERRFETLMATDPQLIAARPDPAVTATLEAAPTLVEVMSAAVAAYADRPALGQHAVKYVTDAGGRTVTELQPHFDTLTYATMWGLVHDLAAAIAGDPVQPGDRATILGFASADYAVIDMALGLVGAVSVPLQTGASATTLHPIIVETAPVAMFASVDFLDEAITLAETGHAPERLIVFNYHHRADDEREAVRRAADHLAALGVTVEPLHLAISRGASRCDVPTRPSANPDDLRLLIYTSGSTGTPKGAMYTDRLVANSWRSWFPPAWDTENRLPAITLNFMPLSHVMGRITLYATLGVGGTAYFTGRADLSTLLEDFALVRPTQLLLVPRIWEMLYQHVQSEVNRRADGTSDRQALEALVMAEQRGTLFGGRQFSALNGSAPLAPELRDWVERLLDVPLIDGYGSTEDGVVLIDGVIRRPPVIDYKLIDVPELGYFLTDRPHPRGELLIKSTDVIPGYYQRPEVTAEVFDADGWYHTGDVMAELGPDQLRYVDRRNNVIKLSQGEFVTVSTLEAAYSGHPAIRQIYVYGNSARSYLLAVIVPTEDTLTASSIDTLKPVLSQALQTVAAQNRLQSYEVPRDFIVETTPFTVENGLLTGIRKLARPLLKKQYGAALEHLYSELADSQDNELRALHSGAKDAPVLHTVIRAAAALLGAAQSDLRADAHFTDLGGDSLSALTFGNLLAELFEVDVPVGIIVSPANDLQAVAAYIDAQRSGALSTPTSAAVHGPGVTEIRAADLTLDKFVDNATLAAAPALPHANNKIRTVLLTGGTGFLGRFLVLEWLERMNLVDGKVIALVRAKSDDDARARLDATFDSGDATLLAQYHALAADHLEVIAGDKGVAHLGLDHVAWQRLANDVDLIVDPAALVNHVLPYAELFGPNVVGTAELIRLALTATVKPFVYVSTIGVGEGIPAGTFVEEVDVRQMSTTRAVDDSYANGYANSKWAGEVLLRQAHDLAGLPVSVFRCDLIMASTTYTGQLNVPDMFTRAVLSLIATGIAPESFYELDAGGARQRAHFDGLPVEFIAEAVCTLGAAVQDGYQTYHVMNPHDDGVSMDTFVDWLVDAGYSISRVSGYSDWLARFETGLRSLPEQQRHASLLPLLHSYREPQRPVNGSLAPADRFREAVQEAKIGLDKDIPHLSAPIVVKCATDLQLLGLL